MCLVLELHPRSVVPFSAKSLLFQQIYKKKTLWIRHEQSGKTFELGGRKKGKRQIIEAQEGYVVKDDIEYGSGNIIPLWAFGLTY